MTVKFPLLDEAGEPWALCGVSTDISERKRAEEDRVRLVAKVQHAQKLESLGVLAGGIAHDFNNLLLAILGNAGLARQQAAPESPLQDELADIEGAAERAAALCRQLLAYSGKGRFVMRPLDLNARIREVVHLLDVSLAHRVQVHLELAPDLPAVKADAMQLDQVMTNLLTNAFDAVGEDFGVVSVESACLELDAEALRCFPDARLVPGSFARVRVRDTGCGMKPEVVARIFDPFFSTKFTGRGLGLAAVQGIVAGHRGAIRVASEPGRGTLFELLLPALDRVPAGEADDETPADWRGSGVVLVVDDEESIRVLARRVLERLGFSVWTAADGEEALRIFGRRADEVRAVLLDATMPVLSGDETLRGLRAIRADVPILLSSGYTGSRQGARDDGATAFLQKPYRPAELAGALRRALA
jgi:nitrogen-specific signal transduction histidine kinase/CheY-like chemotaxis protein